MEEVLFCNYRGLHHFFCFHFTYNFITGLIDLLEQGNHKIMQDSSPFGQTLVILYLQDLCNVHNGRCLCLKAWQSSELLAGRADRRLSPQTRDSLSIQKCIDVYSQFIHQVHAMCPYFVIQTYRFLAVYTCYCHLKKIKVVVCLSAQQLLLCLIYK